MTAQLLDGKKCSQFIQSSLKEKIEERVAQGLRPPGLAVVFVGHDSASEIYVKRKREACAEIGMRSFAYDLPENTTQHALFALIDSLNQQEDVDGILVQMPLPAHIDSDAILERIHPDKDVDGFHPYNLGRLAQRRPLIRPCTPFGIMKLLEFYKVKVLGKHAVIVGASNIVGRPMALELLLEGATITVCHRFTSNLEKHVRNAEILVVAVGKQNIVKPDWISPGAVVVDVGMHRRANGSVCGDLDFSQVVTKASYITPVPGGVGPMTVAMLLYNTFQAATKQA